MDWEDETGASIAQPTGSLWKDPPTAIVYAVPEFIWELSNSIYADAPNLFDVTQKKAC